MFSCILAMDMGRDQLEINILSHHKFLEGMGGFIVKALELGVESRGAKVVVGNLKSGKNGIGTSVFERNSDDAIAVIVIHNKDVIVAGTRGCNEFAGEIHVSLSCGLHHRGKAQVGVGTLVNGWGKASSVGDGEAGVALGRRDVLVEWRFCRVWSRWPLMVAMDCGGCCCKDLRVRPANSGTCPQCRASSSMERHGLKRVAWAKATRSAGEARPMAVLA